MVTTQATGPGFKETLGRFHSRPITLPAARDDEPDPLYFGFTKSFSSFYEARKMADNVNRGVWQYVEDKDMFSGPREDGKAIQTKIHTAHIIEMGDT